MNKLKIILVSAFAALTTSISAQNSYKPIQYPLEEKGVKADGWNEINLQVSPLTLSADENINGTGFSLGYNKTFNIVKDKPVYLVAGANFQYSIFSQTTDGGAGSFTNNGAAVNYKKLNNYDYSLYDINIPVSVMYDIDVTNSFSVAPFAGIKLRAGLGGSIKNTPSASGLDQTTLAALKQADPTVLAETSQGIYEGDNAFKRFNIGWQAGVNLYYNSYTLGFSYGTFINKIAEGTTLKQASITLGYRF